MKKLAGIALLAAALAAVARAEDEEAKKIQLLPEAKKGMKERLVFVTSIDRVTKKDDKGHQALSIECVRKIKEIGEDGLSSREQVTFEKGQMEYDDENGTRQKQDLGMTMTYPIERASKSRRAIVEDGAPEIPDGLAPQLMAVFRRDPDGLARLLTPKDAVKAGDTWQPELAPLLLLLGPKKAKLVADGSKASAKLESLKKKGDKLVAEVTLDATLVYTLPDDPETNVKMRVEATLRGPADGSGAPTREEVTTRTKGADGSKETLQVELDRKKVEGDDK